MQRNERNERRAMMARLRPPNPLRAAVLAAAVTACWCIAPAGACGTAMPDESTQVQARRRLWWLDAQAHSMQEQCFIAWMDGLWGTPVWRHSMQERTVESIYAWWTAAIWHPMVPVAED